MANCVPACATCNFAKTTIPYEDFIDYICSIYDNLTKQGIIKINKKESNE